MLPNRFIGSTKPSVTIVNKNKANCYISYDKSNPDTTIFVNKLEQEFVREAFSFEEINKAKLIIFINSEPYSTMKKNAMLENDLEVIFDVMQHQSASIVTIAHKGGPSDLPFFLRDFMPVVFKNDFSKLIEKIISIVNDSKEKKLRRCPIWILLLTFETLGKIYKVNVVLIQRSIIKTKHFFVIKGAI